jgi:hypothetical protein
LKFPYVQEQYVPTPGESITKVPGIRAAELLFFDTIKDATPKIAATQKYAAFVKAMQTSFVGEDVSGVVTTLGAIKDKVSLAACKGIDDKTATLVPNNLTGALRQRALEMLDRQKAHIPKVMDILYKMFDARNLQTGKGLSFNPKFAAGGMPAVNAIAEEARDLLMQYYSDCEGLYKGGLALFAARVHAASAKASGPAAGQQA